MGLAEKDLNPGDHVYVKRRGILYSHHGIYAGDGKVIHYTGEEKEKRDPLVTETTMGDFLKGGKLRRRDYKKRLPHSESLRIAKGHLSRNGYSLAFNNCEHFASYCVSGKKRSKRVHKVIGAFAGIALAITGTIIQKKRRKKSGDAL
jgi:cell wall-associated NlpC family hydrolase